MAAPRLLSPGEVRCELLGLGVPQGQWGACGGLRRWALPNPWRRRRGAGGGLDAVGVELRGGAEALEGLGGSVAPEQCAALRGESKQRMRRVGARDYSEVRRRGWWWGGVEVRGASAGRRGCLREDGLRVGRRERGGARRERDPRPAPRARLALAGEREALLRSQGIRAEERLGHELRRRRAAVLRLHQLAQPALELDPVRHVRAVLHQPAQRAAPARVTPARKRARLVRAAPARVRLREAEARQVVGGVGARRGDAARRAVLEAPAPRGAWVGRPRGAWAGGRQLVRRVRTHLSTWRRSAAALCGFLQCGHCTVRNSHSS